MGSGLHTGAVGEASSTPSVIVSPKPGQARGGGVILFPGFQLLLADLGSASRCRHLRPLQGSHLHPAKLTSRLVSLLLAADAECPPWPGRAEQIVMSRSGPKGGWGGPTQGSESPLSRLRSWLGQEAQPSSLVRPVFLARSLTH